MRLVKTRSNTSERLGYESRNNAKKLLKEPDFQGRTIAQLSCTVVAYPLWVFGVSTLCFFIISYKTQSIYIRMYSGYCGIPWHSDREAVSSTLVHMVTRASGYPGTRECFHGVKKMTRYCNTRRLMAKHRRR